MAVERTSMGERRLGAIMFTDLVGYSAITSTDEGRALKLLEQHRGLLRTVFQEFGGMVVKTMGDGFLVEFASAVEAVNCAVKAQTEMRKFNEGRGPEKVLVRIGIHVGDVVHSGGDILGDAVNVTARLQPLAEPGGICITRQVVDQIERKVDYKLVKVGTRELKNIRYPVELYRVEVPSGVSQSEGMTLDPRRIAVLPLANLSSDPNDRYFAEGMTDELISTISRIGELSVISRTSVLRYRDTTVPIGEIGRELSAGTVLEGSVRKAGNKVRITTQLIDAQSDRHLWAQSYDRDMTDIFAIQGDIAERVAEALRVQLVSKQKEAVEKKATSSPEAYTLYLKGRYYWNERSVEGVGKAIRYFEDAIRMDPNFALAYSGLADSILIQIDRTWVSYSQGGPTAKGYAEKAVQLDGELAEAHASLGLVLETMWHFASAEKELRKAIELKPNYATAYHWLFVLLSYFGRHEEAFGYEKRAYELDPYSSTVSQGIGIGLLYQGKAHEAVAQLEKVVEGDPKYVSAYYWKSLAYAELGEFDLAIAEAKKGVGAAGSAAYSMKMNLVSMCVRGGRRDEALNVLSEAEKSVPPGSYIPATSAAMVRFDMGEVDEGFRLLERAYLEHDSFIRYFKEFSWYAAYHSDPRWLELQRKIDSQGT